MEIEKHILSAVLHFAVCTFSLSAILLCIRRHSGDKSRIYLAIAFFIAVASFAVRIQASYAGRPLTYHILPIINLHAGLIALMLHYLYPIEVIHPGWFNLRRGFLFFAPWLLLSLLLACIPIHFRVLLSFTDVMQHITEFNVWLRLLIIIMGIIPYSIMLFYIPYNHKKSSANCKWILTYTAGIQGIAIFYTLFMLTGSMAVSIVHVIYCGLFCLVITYREIFLRIAVPVKPREIPCPPPTIAPKVVEQQNDTQTLWTKLNKLMDKEKLWRDPDMNATKLARLLGTNRNRISQIIKKEGHESYNEYINFLRILEFREIADSGQLINVQDTFFAVGFRSKITALRYFRKFTEMTPTEYLQLSSQKAQKRQG